MAKPIHTKTTAEADMKKEGQSLSFDDWDVPADWNETLTGFPPYWLPEAGAKWAGSVIMKDESGDFERYVVRATRPVMCQKGSGDEQERVLVKAGEFFTLSMYSNLQLERFIGLGELIVICKGQITAKTPAGFVWAFRVFPSPATERALAAKDAQNPLLREAAKAPELKAADKQFGQPHHGHDSTDDGPAF
jgi:hypothetical protein